MISVGNSYVSRVTFLFSFLQLFCDVRFFEIYVCIYSTSFRRQSAHVYSIFNNINKQCVTLIRDINAEHDVSWFSLCEDHGNECIKQRCSKCRRKRVVYDRPGWSRCCLTPSFCHKRRWRWPWRCYRRQLRGSPSSSSSSSFSSRSSASAAP